VILAHHAGEDLLLYALAGATGAGSVYLAVARARLGELVRRLSRRGRF
jgi:hypothetical protein